mgnify:CR=1 FL=1|tara:strand:- start:2482 stop:2709 length:228 start_codon:yes stop_codon:yes gene_type:complete
MKPEDLKVFYETKDNVEFAHTYWNTQKIRVEVVDGDKIKTEEELQIELFIKIKSPEVQRLDSYIKNLPPTDAEEI